MFIGAAVSFGYSSRFVNVWRCEHYFNHHCCAVVESKVFGTISNQTIGWNQKLLEVSHANWALVEDKVLIPNTSRLCVFFDAF